MPADTDVRPAREDVRARAAVAAMFFTNGALIANLIPRYPEIKAELGMGNSAYGLAVAAFPAGAIVAGLAAGVLVRRFGSARVAVVSTVLAGLGVIAAGLAPVTLAFAAAGFVAGAMDSITDVAQNAHGLRVQRRYGRSIINSFHAVWSIGAVTGGAMSAGAIALGIDRAPHLIGAVALLAVVALLALRFSLPGPEDAEQPEPVAAAEGAGRFASAGRVVPVLAALVLIATAGTLVEDAGNSWAAIYLGGLGAPAALAASGYIALVGTQFIGRISGDRLVDRFGQRTVARAGGIVVAVGFGLALALPTVPGTVVGFAAAGLGVATLVPAAMHEADELPGLRPGTGLTVVSWLMRLGFLLSPPVVGLIADASSLRLGLVVVPIAGVLVVLLAGVLKQERASA
ncbi:MFS transporter [Actinosynnema pretiosum subsp. pretiosum]|uniref:Major facilitator superfamily MFS_1 n=2 Tax=Actinosynnema TaxID=40566 RepID=C6WFQ7_ACTMD|nr:MFS transporter [Actinosynnema mirum]ACU37843.1 major facilitator superfamily MFS_1 [Actinosynnema mirum DSM 43827]AXX31325.1 Membrane protein mosC [Actinosynnema pretiosum subsp. pretiosum]QUF04616.1 MFS transporter [Actinosynnema pretiosum subsp. pretiosum]